MVCSIEDIRRTTGIGSDIIEDDDVSRLITEGIHTVERYLNTAIVPKTRIEAKDHENGLESNLITVDKYPIIKVKAIKIDGTSVSPEYVKIYRAGAIQLTNEAEVTEFDEGQQANVIKYVYGTLEESETSTTTTSATTAGSSTEIPVNSVNGFKANQWIKIVGMDGYEEITQIDSVGESSITAETTQPHEADSDVIIMRIPYEIKRLIEIVTGLMLVARIVGESYTDIVGYGLGEFNVQKGEPYTQWRETYNQLNSERTNLLKTIRPNPVVV